MMPATIGPYHVLRELGRGGMGEVYLARDSRLDRQVAIKALPVHLSQDPDRLARFQREAKVLASLNHPGIGGIHGLEETDGRQYLVLEFIEGETLESRLKSGPIALEEALGIARQIAGALELAHEKGVIHRDLKPGNVMVTPEGLVKVLDFGLARTDDGSPSSAPSHEAAAGTLDTPTAASPAPIHSPTIPGAILGTAGYMSPEQARGKGVDKRSDIFSFGCVLYEMLTGKGPFRGETVTDSLGAILHREPEWALLPPRTPARVRELLHNCLTKDRRNRLHDIGDARLELERAIGGQEWTQPGFAAARSGVGNRLRWTMAVVAGGALVGAGWLAGRGLVRSAPAITTQTFHVSTVVPAKPELSYVSGIAPDARFVVYRAWQQRQSDSTRPEGMLVVRRLDRDETRVIDAAEGALEAALSPDGRWLAFTAARDLARTKTTLKKIALDDGRPVGQAETLCDLPAGGYFTLCWSSDREIVLAAGWQQAILAVPAAGGEPRVVLREEQSKEIDAWGEVRPMVPGKSVLATRWALVGQTIKERTEAVDLATGKRTPLLANAGGAQLIGNDIILARRNPDALIAARIDLDTLQIIGEPATVLSGGIVSHFFVSESGTLARTTSASDISGRRLMWIDEQGQTQPIAAPPRAYGSIEFSPDTERLVTVLDSTNNAELPTEMWIYDLSRRTFSRISTPEPTFNLMKWHPDGQRIAYGTISNDAASIWTHPADGSGEPAKLFTSTRGQTILIPLDWSPDGKVLATLQVDLAKNATDVLMLEQEAGSAAWGAKTYLNSQANEDLLRFSPDGKWIAFVSDESGRGELYVQRFSGAGAGAEDARSRRTQVSTNGINGGGWWSRDGKEIRYIDADKQLMSVQVQAQTAFAASLPKVLYGIAEYNSSYANTAPDGRMMLVVRGENERATKIDLVLNFLPEVRAKIDAAR